MSARSVPWWREPTRGQWLAFSAAWMGWVMDAFDFTIYLIVAPEIAREFGVSQTAVMGSLTLTLLLRLAGGVVAGSIADRWGRKLPLMLSLVWFAVFDGLVALAPSFAWVIVLRTLFGFGMGAEWTAGSTLAMESWPPRSRGLASGILQGSWAIGFLLAALVSAVVVPAFGWRALFVVAIAPALLALPIRWLVPESHPPRRDRAAPPPLAPMFGQLVSASLLMALGFGVYYALTSAYALMLAGDHGLGVGERWRLMAVFNVGMLCGAVVTGTLARRYGVRAVIAVPAMLALPALPLYVGAVPGGLGIGAFLGGALGVGFTGVVPLVLTDMFPAEVRARAVGIAYHCGAMVAAFVAPGIPALAAARGWTMGSAIAVVAGGFLLVLAATVLLAGRAVIQNRPVSATPA
jgi:MFS transporter, SHS family, lactate transporter